MAIVPKRPACCIYLHILYSLDSKFLLENDLFGLFKKKQPPVAPPPKRFPPVPDWCPEFSQPLEKLIERVRFYTNGDKDFAVLQHGTFVIATEELADSDLEQYALEALRKVFHAHPDMNPSPMKDGNILVRYNHGVGNVVLHEIADLHWDEIDKQHQRTIATDEVLITPLGRNVFDAFGKKALFGRCFMFMDAENPKVVHIVRKTAQKEELRSSISWVAQSIFDRATFVLRAQEVANKSGEKIVEELTGEFHTEGTPPADVADKFRSLGSWLAARQAAIFEILYFIGPKSLPAIRRVAHGVYDWTQGNALELFCRFAADGIERSEIIAELATLIPRLRYEAVAYMIEPLFVRAKENREIQRILDELCSVQSFKEVFDELTGPDNG